MPLDDEQLMAQVAEGDERAFSTLVQRHLPRAYAIARRVLPEQADAEDAAQEAFTRVWTHACDWQPGRARFTTWFHSILVHQCLDQLRRRKRRPETDIDTLLDELLDPDTPADQQLQQAREAAELHRVVQRLPDRQRMAVVLCYFEAHSTPQAAAAMGLHVKALEGLLGRARAQLRRWLPSRRNEEESP